MRINRELYYFCQLGKGTFNLAKARAHCTAVNCENLGIRPKKNGFSKRRRSATLLNQFLRTIISATFEETTPHYGK